MRSDRLYLADILDAIEAIQCFTSGIDEARFIADELIQSAVLQKLSVIGEAAERLSEATRAQIPEISGRKLSDFAMWRCMRTFQWTGASCL
jgi:uncharacterized protein with HEPN domain